MPIDEEAELRKMTTRQLVAYHNILLMNQRMIQVTDDPGKNNRHLEIVNRILGLDATEQTSLIRYEGKEVLS